MEFFLSYSLHDKVEWLLKCSAKPVYDHNNLDRPGCQHLHGYIFITSAYQDLQRKKSSRHSLPDAVDLNGRVDPVGLVWHPEKRSHYHYFQRGVTHDQPADPFLQFPVPGQIDLFILPGQ
jgi:hypothetical protein